MILVFGTDFSGLLISYLPRHLQNREGISRRAPLCGSKMTGEANQSWQDIDQSKTLL